MLRYDAAWLLDYYHGESPVRPGIPYAPLAACDSWQLVCDPEQFQLNDVLQLRPKLDYDEPVVRLVSVEGGTLRVQRAVFSDGVKSNYAMDGPGELRDTLRDEYGAKLPPLSDTRLSNGIGTAVVVFDASGRPYLPRRAPRQSVFPGGYHCTASGETVWTGECDFTRLFTGNICRELEEEAGIVPGDLDWIRPVGFCREFLRAGKPQIFFAACTSLSAEALTSRRRSAIAAQLSRGRQEILDEVMEDFQPALCTIECLANLALAGWPEELSPTSHRLSLTRPRPLPSSSPSR
jgi:hypothetical protein